MSKEQKLHVLLVDDEQIIHETIGDYLRDSGHVVDDARDGEEALRLLKVNEYDLSLVDLKMPELDGMALLGKCQNWLSTMPFVIITGHGTMERVIEALRLGAADFLTKPVRLLELDAVVEKCLRLRKLRQEKQHLKETIRGLQKAQNLTDDRRFVGGSASTARVRQQVRQAVDAECDTILVTGETGTGKEIVAREIHHLAGGDDAPFIAVSCPALPESLVESELFGHVRGAFTGATQDRAGYFELADGGSLFLDEIADLSAAAQATLLRVLETRSLRRVGGSREIDVHVRIIAATNVQLEKLVEDGNFRQDLYYRLNVYGIELDPLRKRRDDVMPLAEHFLQNYAMNRNMHFDGFSPDARDILVAYEYPGNARELRNIVERAAILCRSGQIQPEHLSLPRLAGDDVDKTAPSTRDDDEKSRILAALENTHWNRRQAAADLDMPYSTLRYKLKTLGIE